MEGSTVSEQMILPLAQQFGRSTFENFYAGKHIAVVESLQAMLGGQGERAIYLAGAPGCGKTHLLQACCSAMHIQGRTAMYLPAQQVAQQLQSMPQDIQAYLDGLAGTDLLCIDDIQCMLGIPAWEEAWFHLYNQAAAAGSLWLVAADCLPGQLNCQLADLQSRLAWGLVLQLPALDDDEKINALQHCAAARGLELPAAAAHYLLRHAARDMPGLMLLFDKLDAAAWRCKRRLTVQFIKQTLQL